MYGGTYGTQYTIIPMIYEECASGSTLLNDKISSETNKSHNEQLLKMTPYKNSIVLGFMYTLTTITGMSCKIEIQNTTI